ncbi:MAG: ATP-binding cassette domain-containing protein [Oscillospiraceae bacterium]
MNNSNDKINPMELKTKDFDSSNNIVLNKSAGDIIKAENLSVSFSKKEVLHNLNFTVKKNTITSIIGQSGCGKSTLLKALNLIIYEENGTINGKIEFENTDILTLPLQTIRKEIGMVFQQPVVFPTSIYKNMEFGLKYHFKLSKQQTDEKITLCLKQAKLYDEVCNNLSDNAEKLSGGQKQRLSIARELAIEPKILMLDEPCSALDIKNTLMIEEMLSEIKTKFTILIVTHNLAQAKRISDNIIFIDDGKIIEADTANNFFNLPKTDLAKEYIKYMEM